MKKMLLIGFVLTGLNAAAQDGMTYTDLLQQTNEIKLTDSLLINNLSEEMTPIDSASAQRWFSPVFASSQSGKLKKRDFYIAGKITTNDYYDLLLVSEEKKKTDSSSMQVFYLVTAKKDGQYIASFKAAVMGMNKKVSYNVSSWLYKGFKIVQDSKITTANDSFSDMTEYTISGKGRFIAFARN